MDGKQLHVLNGDSTLFQFREAKIKGNHLVWREILCEGPVSENIQHPDFWEQRRHFLINSYEATTEEFKEKTTEEIRKLDEYNKYEELILWFEYDLFCQINLLGVLAFINQKKLVFQKISLICIGEVPGYNRLVGLGEIDFKLYPGLMESRISLTNNDLKIANNIWKQYCSNNPIPLLEMTKEISEKLPYLNPSIQAHFRRFPSSFHGLSQIQQEMLDLIQIEKIESERQLVGKMLRKEDFYGFGDLQYFKILDSLAFLIDKGKRLLLNDLGEKVITGKENYLKWKKDEYWIGGAKNTHFCWDENLSQLIPNEGRLGKV